MAVTSKTKSFTALIAETSLNPSEALDVVRWAASQVQGERGVGKVEGQWKKGNNQVLIEADSEAKLTLKVAMTNPS